MEVAITGPDDGDAIQLGPIRMRILEDGSTTDHRLGMGEITLPPHTDGPPQHRHARHDEGFYVVSGTASFTVATRPMTLPPARWSWSLPALRTPSPIPAMSPRCCSTRSPRTSTSQYFRDLRDMIVAGQPFTPEATVEVMARYATVPATDYAG